MYTQMWSFVHARFFGIDMVIIKCTVSYSILVNTQKSLLFQCLCGIYTDILRLIGPDQDR